MVKCVVCKKLLQNVPSYLEGLPFTCEPTCEKQAQVLDNLVKYKAPTPEYHEPPLVARA